MKLIELTRICIGCGERKSWKKFYKQRRGRFGIRTICIICMLAYYEKNKKQITVRRKKYYEINKEYFKEYRKVNKEYFKEYYKTNKKQRKEYFKKYYKANKEQRKEYVKEYHKKRYKLNIQVRLSCKMSTLIRRSLKNGNGKNGKHWETLVPYTINDLIKRLKETLPKGYTWNDYVSGKANLHIDHIIPISVHNFKSYTDTDFQRCWALKNLQLLSAKDNMSKNAKLTKPFQPSLLL